MTVDVETRPMQRWWLATAWLWCVLFVDTLNFIVLIYLMFRPSAAPSTPFWLHDVGVAVAAGQIVALIALLRWRRWGWWLLIFCAAVTVLCLLLAHVALWKTALGIGGVLVTFLVLRSGGTQAAWPRLQ